MHETDLRFLLMDYADRYNTPYIDRDAFFKELSTQAIYKAQKNRQWEVWTNRPREKFETELSILIKTGVCSIQKNSGMEYIYMPSFFVERVREAWNDIETHEKNIFPDAKKINIELPADLTQAYSYGDLVKLLHDPQKTDVPIIQVLFPEDLGSMYLLAPFVETRLLDAAIAKVRRILVSKNNKIHCLTKIRSVFPDRLIQANTIIETIVKSPINCVKIMREGDESAFMLWIRLCEFIKETAESGSIPPAESDIAVKQAAVIIEIYNNYYREIAAERSEKENLLLELYAKLSDPPYFWTFTEIYKIPIKTGRPIIESIRHEEISEFILKKTYDTGESVTQPPLLIFYDEYKEKVFVKKELLFSAFNALISATRKTITESVHRKWYRILKNYSLDESMKNDMAFETLLIKTLKRIRPFVLILHQDPKPRLLRKEFSSQDVISGGEAEQFFHGSEMKSITALYKLDRRRIMHDVKLNLPFWYSIPIFVAIMRLFRGKNHHADSDDNDD